MKKKSLVMDVIFSSRTKEIGDHPTTITMYEDCNTGLRVVVSNDDVIYLSFTLGVHAAISFAYALIDTIPVEYTISAYTHTGIMYKVKTGEYGKDDRYISFYDLFTAHMTGAEAKRIYNFIMRVFKKDVNK